MAWAEEACRAVEKATRFMFRFRFKVDWEPGEASHCVDVAWLNERERVSACDSSPPNHPEPAPPISDTNRVNDVSIVNTVESHCLRVSDRKPILLAKARINLKTKQAKTGKNRPKTAKRPSTAKLFASL
jgi:hypothetical protein